MILLLSPKMRESLYRYTRTGEVSHDYGDKGPSIVAQKQHALESERLYMATMYWLGNTSRTEHCR
jgi:hypothetical protein